MANIILGAATEKTVRYRGGIVQIDDGSDQFQIKFATDFVIQFNDEFTDEDFIDDGEPIRSPKSDRIGNASMIMKNLVDMVDTVSPATNEETVSYWLEGIATQDYRIVKFIKVFKAPKSTGDKYARLRVTCRVIDVKFSTLDDVAVDETEAIMEVLDIDTPTYIRSAA